MSEDIKKVLPALKEATKAFFTKNIAIKILSLVFAMLIWGYVLMAENPNRVKIVDHVQVTIEGEADLIARKLVLRGDREEILREVSVRVNTVLTEYENLSADDIVATISLNTVTSEGNYPLTVNAKSTTGTVIAVTPATVDVEIDKLVTRSIPVDAVKRGELPAGYWAGALTKSDAMIKIEGAATDVSGMVKAVCYVDLAGRTESINESMPLVLFNKEGNELDSSLLLVQMPSTIIKMEILPVKRVPVDYEAAIMGIDSLPDNYEVASYGISGSEVRIVGDAETLASIDKLDIEPVDVSGSTESVLTELAIIVPDGVRLLDDGMVNLYVNIREKSAEASFVAVKLDVAGLGHKLSAVLDVQTADVTITGRTSLVSLLERSDVELYVDVTGMAAGTYQIPISIRLPNDRMMTDLSWLITPEKVNVTIK